MFKRLEFWGWGLLSAMVTGVATAAGTFLGIGAANGLGAGIPTLSWKQLLAAAVFGGLSGAVAYLMKSPLPDIQDSTGSGAPTASKVGLLLACLGLGLGLAGCSTPQLAPGGPYSNLGTAGSWLYGCDTVVADAYATLDAFENWELLNHAYLATNSAAIESAAQVIRAHAPGYFKDYVAARATLVGLIAGTNAPALVTVASNQVQAAFGGVTNLLSLTSTNPVTATQ
jgi:hypothetical protein